MTWKVTDSPICPVCDWPNEVEATGLDQRIQCANCGAWLALEYDAECDERGMWRGGYRAHTVKPT